MKRMSPPTEVQARPVATPGTAVRSATSFSKRRGPRMACRSSGLISSFPEKPSAIFIAAERSTEPISRSRLRTPASRV